MSTVNVGIDTDFFEDGLQRTLLYNNNEGLKTILDGEASAKSEQLQLVLKRWKALERAYQQKKHDLESLNDEKRHFEMEKKMLNLKIQSLTKANERVKEIPEELQREKNKREETEIENQTLKNEIERLRSTITTLENEKVGLVEKSEVLSKHVEEANCAVKNLEEQLENVGKESRMSHNETVLELQKTIESLTIRNNTLTNTLKVMEEKYNDELDRSDKLKAATLKDRNESQQLSLSKDSKIDSLSKQLNETTRKMEKLLIENKQLKTKSEQVDAKQGADLKEISNTPIIPKLNLMSKPRSRKSDTSMLSSRSSITSRPLSRQSPTSPVLSSQARVLYSYFPQSKMEVELEQGEIITVTGKYSENGMWFGRNSKGNMGLFPCNLVKIIN
jgi:chromosome segregation ATPase